MIKILSAVLIAVTAISSCQKIDSANLGVLDTTESKEVQINLTFSSVDVEQTKALTPSQESVVENVNLYCYSENLKIIKQLYITDFSAVSLNLYTGVWKFFDIANIGYNIGEMTYDELLAYSYSIAQESNLEQSDRLLMKHQSDIAVTESKRIDIALERVVAKIDLRVWLSSDMKDVVMLKTAKLVNVPTSCSLFSGSTSAPSVSSLISYQPIACYDGALFSFYMLENRSGDNVFITSPSDRTSANATPTASYIEIAAETVDAWITYVIYLGGNDTTNFDVLGNNIYDVDLLINRVNPEDCRVTVRLFPKDIAVNIESCATHNYEINYTTGYVNDADYTEVTVCVSLSQAVPYDVDVYLEAYNDKTLTETEIITAPCASAFDRDLVIRIAAGNRSSEEMFTYARANVLFDHCSHMLITGVEKVSDQDENNYFPSVSMFESVVTMSWVWYHEM